MSNETYVCAQCGGTYEKTWTDEEAMAEAVDNFGAHLGDDPAIICDDCYQAMIVAVPPADWVKNQ